MDTATMPKDSVQNDKRDVSIELLNSTLKATSYLGKKGEPTQNQHLSTPLRKRGTDENLQLTLSFYLKHPRQDLTNLFYAGCQQFWKIRILLFFLPMHEKLFLSNPLLYLSQESNYLLEALNGFPNFRFCK